MLKQATEYFIREPNTDLVTQESYQNFELALELKVSKGGKSGVFLHLQENRSQESRKVNSANWPDNFEMQF